MKRGEVIEMNGKDNGYGELEEAILYTIEILGMKPQLKHHIHYFQMDMI